MSTAELDILEHFVNTIQTDCMTEEHVINALRLWCEVESASRNVTFKGLLAKATFTDASHGKPFPKTNRTFKIMNLQTSDQKNSLLHAACLLGKSYIVKSLLNAGARPTLVNSQGLTPLHIAARYGWVSTIEILVAVDSSLVNIATPNGKTPIYSAVKHAHPKAVQVLLDHGAHTYPQRINSQIPAAKSLLCVAATQANPNILDILIKTGKMDVNEPCEVVRVVPLLVACEAGSYHVVKYLIALPHINITVFTPNNESPLYLACKSGHPDLVELILKDPRFDCVTPKKNGSTPLYSACRHGYLQVVQLLVQYKKAQLQARRDGGVTAFHVACWAGHLEVAKYLHTVDPSIVNKQKKDQGTPLHSACEKGKEEIAKWLVHELGHDISCQNRSGETPLYLACRNGHIDVVKWLVNEHNQDVNAMRSDGTSLLMAAARQSKNEVAQFLIDKGADINAERRGGSTPIYVACSSNNLELFQMLVQAGANVETSSPNIHFMPLEVAVHYKSDAVLRYCFRTFKDVLDRLALRLLVSARQDNRPRQFCLISAYDGLNGGMATALFARLVPTLVFTVDPAVPRQVQVQTSEFVGYSPCVRAYLGGYEEDVKWMLQSGLDDPTRFSTTMAGLQREALWHNTEAASHAVMVSFQPWSPQLHSWFGPRFRLLASRLIMFNRIAESRTHRGLTARFLAEWLILRIISLIPRNGVLNLFRDDAPTLQEKGRSLMANVLSNRAFVPPRLHRRMVQQQDHQDPQANAANIHQFHQQLHQHFVQYHQIQLQQVNRMQALILAHRAQAARNQQQPVLDPDSPFAAAEAQAMSTLMEDHFQAPPDMYLQRLQQFPQQFAVPARPRNVQAVPVQRYAQPRPAPAQIANDQDMEHMDNVDDDDVEMGFEQ